MGMEGCSRALVADENVAGFQAWLVVELVRRGGGGG